LVLLVSETRVVDALVERVGVLLTLEFWHGEDDPNNTSPAELYCTDEAWN